MKPLFLTILMILPFPVMSMIVEEPTPKDLVEYTCYEFAQKAKNCERYTCQAPSVLDPTVKTEWNILNAVNNRCLIADTTADLGFRDEYDNPKPITRTCEYSKTGVDILVTFLEELRAGYYKPPVDYPDDGSYNCQFTTTNDESIKPAPYQVMEEPESSI